MEETNVEVQHMLKIIKNAILGDPKIRQQLAPFIKRHTQYQGMARLIRLFQKIVFFRANHIAKFIINNGLDIHRKYLQREVTLLHLVVHLGNTEMVKFLLAKGANIDDQDKNGWTPLHYALYYNFPEIADFLMKHGAKFKTTDSLAMEFLGPALSSKSNINMTIMDDKSTSLHCACRMGCLEAVQFLIESGADVNSIAFNGYSPFFYAIFNNNIELAKLLLANGASLNLQTNEGHTPLHTATVLENIELIKLILASNNNIINMVDFSNKSPLIIALENELISIAFLFLRKGAKAGPDALYNAVKNGFFDKSSYIKSRKNYKMTHLNLIKPLLKAGADLNFKDSKGRNVLYIAVEQENCPLIEKLLKVGLPADSCDDDNFSLLHFSFNSYDPEVTETFIKHSTCDINKVDESGNSLFYKAVFAIRPKLVSLILKRLKIVSRKFCNNFFNFLFEHVINNPLTWLATRDSLNLIIEDLLKHGLKVSQAQKNSIYLHLFTEINCCKLVHILLKAGVNPNSHSQYEHKRRSHLEVAVDLDHTEVAILLLEFGAELTDPQLPLCAIKNDNMKIIKTLIEKRKISPSQLLIYEAVNYGASKVLKYCFTLGCDFDLNSDRLLPMAAHQADLGIIQMLLKNGANPDFKDCTGDTPLHIVCKAGCFSSVSLLLSYGADVNLKNSSGLTPLQCCDSLIEKFFITEHIVKLKAANKFVEDDCCLESLDKNSRLYALFEACVAELSELKQIKFTLRFSCFDFLTASDDQAAKFIQNKKLRSSIQSMNFNKDFPIYANILSNHLKKASRRFPLLKKAILVLDDKFNRILPPEIVEKILGYLNEEELEILYTPKPKIQPFGFLMTF